MKQTLAVLLIVATMAVVNCGMDEYLLKYRVLTPAEKDELLQIGKDCKTEHNVPDEVFEQLKKGEWPENRELKCFLKCCAIKYGTLKENGDVNLTRLETTVSKRYYDIIAECSKIQADDLCDRVYAIRKCSRDAYEKKNVL